MPEFTCGACRGRLQVLAEHVGVVVACPHCGEHVSTVRSQPAPVAPAAAPPPSRRALRARSRRHTAPENGTVILGIAGLAYLVCCAPPAYVGFASDFSARETPRVTPALVVFALLPCAAVPLFVVAWAMGSAHRAQARRAGSSPQATAVAGWILGMVGAILWVTSFAIGLVGGFLRGGG